VLAAEVPDNVAVAAENAVVTVPIRDDPAAMVSTVELVREA
jgi:hypothetical protein